MSTYKIIGQSTPRAEGPEKVTGSAGYSADVQLSGTLWGRSLRSPLPHAKIISIDVSRAAKVPGVHAVLTGADLQGALQGRKLRDTPVLAWDRVRFIGERVAAMMRGTFDAFARQDEAAALEVYDQDNRIDSEYKRLLSYTTSEMQKSTDDMQDWLDVLWAMRSLERIGDRCKNVCEYVVYLTRGTDVRHTPLENMQQKLEDLT